MLRRYGLLFVGALGAALLLGRFARGPQAVVPVSEPVAAEMSVTLEVRARDVVASTESIPAGQRVVLRVTNASAAPVRLRLAGYEDRVDSGPLEPRETFEVTFLADRPGDRFAWLVGEEPRGRLDITGSHLVEGHR